MTYSTLDIRKDGPTDWVTLNRPDKMNALNTQLVDDLLDYFGKLYWDQSVRIVVLRGAGKAYCAGLDLKEGSNNSGGGVGGSTPQHGLRTQRRISEIVMRMRRCPQPIISLVHGPACGGGFALALASDIRIAGESARMNAAFIRIGLSACDIGVSYFLPRLVGTSVASELMLTGRFINAARAERTGLVSEVVPDDQLEAAAAPYIDEMLTTAPLGLRLTKECLNMSVDAGGLEAAIAMEDRNQILCSQTSDVGEGVRAFLEKRRPVYNDR
jgi:enoyl-CoA hydratase